MVPIVLIALTVLIALIVLIVLIALGVPTDPTDAPIPPMNLTGMMKNAKTMNHGLSMQATSTALPMSNKNACR